MTAETPESVGSSEAIALTTTPARQRRGEWSISHVCWGRSPAPPPYRSQPLLRPGKQGGRHDGRIAAMRFHCGPPVPSRPQTAGLTDHPGTVLDPRAHSIRVAILDPGRSAYAGAAAMAAVCVVVGTLSDRANGVVVFINDALSSGDHGVDAPMPAVGRCLRHRPRIPLNVRHVMAHPGLPPAHHVIHRKGGRAAGRFGHDRGAFHPAPNGCRARLARFDRMAEFAHRGFIVHSVLGEPGAEFHEASRHCLI